MSKTKIAWTERTWNPVTGCDPVSPGCDNCYAEKMAKRLYAMDSYKYRNAFGVTYHPEVCAQPLRWTKPHMVFVCSMADLFHHLVTDQQLFEILMMIEAGAAKGSIFQILTKRPARMLTTFQDRQPHKNIWLGVTVEDQMWLDRRVRILLRTPAAVRWLCLEPMLGPVDFGSVRFRGDTDYFLNPLIKRYSERPNVWNEDGRAFIHGLSSLGGIHWVVIGCESGPKRRPCKLAWVRDVVHQCKEAGVPVFVKQLDIDGKVVRDIDQFPEDLRIRQYPEVRDE